MRQFFNSNSDTEGRMDEADILNGIKVEILREKRMKLVKSLNPERHFDYLRSKSVLSALDCEEIMHKVGRERQASLFLDKLLDHGNTAYDRLCESLLYERTQLFLLKMLNMEYENRKNNCQALFRQDTTRAPGIPIATPDDLPVPPVPNPTNPYMLRSQKSLAMEDSTA